MIKVGILGATGYTALELIKLLLRHPEVEIVLATTRQEDTPHIGSVHPQLVGRLDLRLTNTSPEDVAAQCDGVFCCLPHAASATVIKDLLHSSAKIVDFSADYRLQDAATYQLWYGNQHPDPTRLGEVAYGLPELFREKIVPSQLVANPGCYPTSAILAMAPLLREKVVSPDVVFDSKSGVSGAGRTPKLMTHYPECNESVAAYGVGQHRHTPEIVQILGLATGQEVDVVFTPHLVPMDRGILSTGYATRTGDISTEQVLGLYRDFYRDEPFIRIVDDLPSTKSVCHANFCDITARVVGNRVVTVSCIDNLIKGASGAAVQNMNLMFGFPETMALL